MDITTFHNNMIRNCGRGTGILTDVQECTRRAARWIERNYSFQYMRKFLVTTVDVDATDARFVSLPARLKRERFVRRVDGSSGNYVRLTKVDPASVVSISQGAPEAYWFDGDDAIVLSSLPDEDFVLEIQFEQYSAWPTGGTHWLLENAEDALQARTMSYLAVVLRDTSLKVLYDAELKEALATLIPADENLEYSGQDLHLRYEGE